MRPAQQWFFALRARARDRRHRDVRPAARERAPDAQHPPGPGARRLERRLAGNHAWPWIDCSCSSWPPAAVPSRRSSTACRWQRSAPAGGSTSLAVHEYTLAGRNELMLGHRSGRSRYDGTEPTPRRDRSDLGAGASGARAAGPVAGRSRGARARRRRVGGRPKAARTTRRRRIDARSIFPSAFRAGAGSTRRRSRVDDAVQAGHPRVSAAARGRARAGQSRSADRRLEASLRRARDGVPDRRGYRDAALP